MLRSIPPRVFIIALSAALAVAIGAPRVAGQAPKEPGTVILKGAPLGGVKFDHKTHSERANKKCETCHHASKPEKPSKAAQEKCTNCHTKAVAAPMKTTTRGAFHDPLAKSGTCIDCHAKSVAAGKKVPTPGKCPECHKKENV